MNIKETIDKMLLEMAQRKELRRLARLKRNEEKAIEDKRKFDDENLRLGREAALEESKAEIRKAQNLNQPKPGTQKQVKSGFDKFQDFATNFANQPPVMEQPKVGGINEKNTKRRF